MVHGHDGSRQDLTEQLTPQLRLSTKRSVSSSVIRRPPFKCVSAAGHLASSASPVHVEEFTTWFVLAFVGVRTKVIALGLEQVRG